MRLPTARSRAATVLALAVAGSVVLTAAPATAAPDTERLGNKLAREVTVGGVNRHLIALQRIAVAVGIPSGGIFTGAEVEKSEPQQAKWGGTAGIPFDPCYHQACDNLGNVNRSILDKNADAVAFAVGRYALDTSDINGVGATGAKAKAAAAKAKAARTAAARTTALSTASPATQVA